MLNKSEIEKFKNILLDEEKILQNKIKEMEAPTDFGDAVDHGEEESDEDEELENRSSVAETYRDRLVNVQSALNRITENKYGLCSNCGNEIETDLLNSVPESNLCKDCKK
ncbi:MAG TPA: hypothetical protein VI432_02490 [Candidatus Paceibacterota bacterium]